MKKWLKKGLAVALCAALLVPLHTQSVAAHEVFHEERTTTRLSRDTYLHEINRVTRGGLLTFSVLEIPLFDPYLEIGVFNSTVEYGLKQATTTLLNAHGAFAGVNGDFFGLAGRHSVSLGLEVVDGQVSVHDGINYESYTTASVLFGADSVFIDYVRPRIWLELDGEEIFTVAMVNMVSNLMFPSFLTHGYFENTACIDGRLGRSYKIVVENGYVIGITYWTVNVPENGFVVVMSPQIFYNNYALFYIGQQASMNITANIDIDAVHTAISGENRILFHGEITPATNRFAARNPRTLLGLNYEADRLILMAIDGRGTSVGVGLPEAAQMMLEFGAYHAITLDGGGSTTMAAARPGASLTLINTPSEGTQRQVINAIGVISNAALGSIHSLQIVQPQHYVPVGVATSLEIWAFDEYMTRLHLPIDAVEIIVYNGHVEEGRLFAHGTGGVYVQVQFGEVAAQARFHGVELAQIIPSAEIIYGTRWLNFRGVDNYGRVVELERESLNFQAVPPYLGAMDGGWFVPNYAGSGWLTVAAHNARAFIPIVPNPYADVVFGMPQSDRARDSLQREYLPALAENEREIWYLGRGLVHLSYYWYDNFVIHVDAGERGLVATDPALWGYLTTRLAQTNAQNIVVRTNLPRLTSAPNLEIQMFHSLLRELADAGHNVFVVSASGAANFSYLRDGVRYINLAHHYEYYYGSYYLRHSGIFTLRIAPEEIYYTVEMIHWW